MPPSVCPRAGFRRIDWQRKCRTGRIPEQLEVVVAVVKIRRRLRWVGQADPRERDFVG